jgi:hypothetical protein
MENRSDINKNFVPYELALKLKELSFNEMCFGSFRTDKYLNYGRGLLGSLTEVDYLNIHSEFSCLAPLYQQIFDWFDDNYNLMSSIQIKSKNHLGSNYFYVIKNHTDFIDNDHIIIAENFSSKLEARIACLKRLIEIVK